LFVIFTGALEVSLEEKKSWCQVLTSYNYNIKLPSDMLAFAYFPYGALGRKEYFGYKNISRFKRGSKGGEEQKTEERIDEGRDGCELHDNDDGMFEVKMKSMLIKTLSRDEGIYIVVHHSPPEIPES
jgi:hypothetical protein